MTIKFKKFPNRIKCLTELWFKLWFKNTFSAQICSISMVLENKDFGGNHLLHRVYNDFHPFFNWKN